MLDHLKLDGSRSAAAGVRLQDDRWRLSARAGGERVAAATMRAGRPRASAFLAASVGGPSERRTSRGAALVATCGSYSRAQRAFAAQPTLDPSDRPQARLQRRRMARQRDGLGGGRYPYDVNAVLVPAALTAAAQLMASGSSRPLSAARTIAPCSLVRHTMAEVWRTLAPRPFDVVIPHREARGRRALRGRTVHPARPRDRGRSGRGSCAFMPLRSPPRASRSGSCIRMRGLRCCSQSRPPQTLDRAVTALLRPFPAGLMTGVGMLVANPALLRACAAALLQPQRLPRHGRLVVAAGPVRGRARAPARAPGSAPDACVSTSWQRSALSGRRSRRRAP